MSCVLCGSDRGLDDRGDYVVCSNCAREQRECEERRKAGKLLDRECSPLCVKCGLCCVVLSAEVKPNEVERLANWSGRLPTEIAMAEHFPVHKGKLVLKRPCVFLLGKPGEYVSCRAYSMDRPKVCGEYLCKLAIRYKAGACTLNEALFILRASVTYRGNIGMFNWSSDKEGNDNDETLAAIVAANRSLKMLNQDSKALDNVRIALFEKLRPNYRFASDAHETIFAAIMVNCENEVLELNHFFDEEEIEAMDEREREVSLKAAHQVVENLSQFFISVPQGKKPGNT